MSASRCLLVVADDRTGALEVGGVCADAGLGPVDVLAEVADHLATDEIRPITVVDLATRHLAPDAAAARVRALAIRPAEWSAHKIDSTLRGNWAHELLARLERGHARVLLIPAFPALGRTCVGGVVLEHGRPVAERAAARDVRSPVRSSRPAEHLRLADGSNIVEVALDRRLSDWISRGEGIAVCDASTDADLATIANSWVAAGDSGIVIAGTAGSIGAAAASFAKATDSNWVAPLGLTVSPSHPVLALPALVVCGSLHPGARSQVAELLARGASLITVGNGATDDLVVPRQRAASGITVLVSAVPVAQPVAVAQADAMAALLGDSARRLIAAAGFTTAGFSTVVIIGGDTVAAVLGDATMSVGGTVAAGMPWFRSAVAGGALVVTKSGGFGSRHALTDLLSQRRPE